MFDIGFKFIKVASFDCASHKLIEEICKKKFDHLIISTGATYNREIEKTVSIVKKILLTFHYYIAFYLSHTIK